MTLTALRVREARVTYVAQTIQTATLGGRIASPRSAADILMGFTLPNGCRLPDDGVENFGIVMLNTKHVVTGITLLTRGCLDKTVVHPRELFQAAILHGAAAIILFHNHPSGDPTPSADDRRLTERMVAAGVLLGIPVLDHVIVAGDTYFSDREKGAL